MKLTAEQKRALDACWPRALAYIKRFGDRSYPRLMDDLREITRHSDSLSTFRWSRSRISKLKKQAGLKMKAQTIRTEAQENRLVKWIRKIRSRRICNTVTTALVKQEWSKIYRGSKKASKSNLHRFRTRHRMKTIKNPKTGNLDIWVFLTDDQ